ncbi:hypothetical protein P4105_27525 [Pseudomonas aeruginosa]|nr:hypothetical protein [Pseudomonas aeruginosa]
MHCPMVGQFGRANTAGSLDGHPKLVTFYQPDLEGALRVQSRRFANVASRGGGSWKVCSRTTTACSPGCAANSAKAIAYVPVT